MRSLKCTNTLDFGTHRFFLKSNYSQPCIETETFTTKSAMSPIFTAICQNWLFSELHNGKDDFRQQTITSKSNQNTDKYFLFNRRLCSV